MPAIQDWWNNLTAWLTDSTPGPTREEIEQELDAPKIRAFYATQKAFQKGGRGRFGQVLRGGGTPSDRPDQASFTPGLPAGLDYAVNEWEGPAGKGWELVVWADDGSTLHVPHEGDPWWADPTPEVLP